MARLALALVLAAALAGCADRPRGVMAPVATPPPPGAGTVDMLVVTTRQRAPDDATLFTGERGEDLSFVDVAVSVPPAGARAVGEVRWPGTVPGNPATDFVVTRADVLPLATVRARFDTILRRPGIGGRVLVFVHGYNTRFEDAVMRQAQIAHDTGASRVPVLFTWPSRGQLTAYTYDRESANYSRDALERALAEISRHPGVRDIAVIAHSMGGWVTLEALRQMAIRSGRVHPKITQVMLAAPDVDVDVFRTQLAALGAARPTITLFVSRDDTALDLSRRVWGDVARVGSVDASAEPYHALFERERVEVIDLTRLATSDPIAHEKFARGAEVVRFIGRRLLAGQRIGDHDGSFGERVGLVGSDVGAAVGGILTAPLRVLAGDR
mgnify:CR=1 FL=1